MSGEIKSFFLFIACVFILGFVAGRAFAFSEDYPKYYTCPNDTIRAALSPVDEGTFVAGCRLMKYEEPLDPGTCMNCCGGDWTCASNPPPDCSRCSKPLPNPDPLSKTLTLHELAHGIAELRDRINKMHPNGFFYADGKLHLE